MAKQKGVWILSYKSNPIMAGNTRTACLEYMKEDSKVERDLSDYSIIKLDYIDRQLLSNSPMWYTISRRRTK